MSATLDQQLFSQAGAYITHNAAMNDMNRDSLSDPASSGATKRLFIPFFPHICSSTPQDL